jgi:hypothetical protein
MWTLMACWLSDPEEVTVLAEYPCEQGSLELVSVHRGPSMATMGSTHMELRHKRASGRIWFAVLPAHLRSGMGPPMERTGARDSGKMLQVTLDPIQLEPKEAQAIQRCAEANSGPLYASASSRYIGSGQALDPVPELVFWSGYFSQLEPVFFGPDETKFQVERSGKLSFVATPTASRPLHTRSLGQVRDGVVYCCTQDAAYNVDSLDAYTDHKGKTLNDYLGPAQAIQLAEPPAEPSEEAAPPAANPPTAP